MAYPTSFKIGDKAAEKWTEEEVEKIINKMTLNAIYDDTILCLWDAIRSVGLYYSGLDYLMKKFPNFESNKKDIQFAIVSRINKKALEGDFAAAPAIWRFKQLGERDESTTNHQNNGASFEPSIHVTSQSQADNIKSLLNKFDDEDNTNI